MKMGIGLQYQIVKKLNCCLAAPARAFHAFFQGEKSEAIRFPSRNLDREFTDLLASLVASSGCEHMNREMSPGAGRELKWAEFFFPGGNRIWK